jgi:hypothetical protein
MPIWDALMQLEMPMCPSAMCVLNAYARYIDGEEYDSVLASLEGLDTERAMFMILVNYAGQSGGE